MKIEHKIVLGSKSPRRIELLQQICQNIEVRIQDVEEVYPENLIGEEVPVYLSDLKASALVASLGVDELLLTADTVVVLNHQILGKPLDRDDAIAILSQLSGNKHVVVSGCTLQSKTKKVQFSETTEVYFKPLKMDDISYYVDTFKPFDKAGAYGIQEWIGMIGIERINGCYYNVMGLPVARLFQELQNF